MRPAVALAFLLLAPGCTAPAERVAVAPATAVVDAAAPAPVGGNPLVGGVALPTDRSIAATLPLTPALSVLTRLVAAGGKPAPLASPGPLTFFAPTDEAFGRLAPGTVDALLKPENGAALSRLIALHSVTGRLTSAELIRLVTAGGGRATLTSLAGEPLTLSMTGNVVTLTDAGGNRSYIEVADVRAANGTVHIVNGVLVPRL